MKITEMVEAAARELTKRMRHRAEGENIDIVFEYSSLKEELRKLYPADCKLAIAGIYSATTTLTKNGTFKKVPGGWELTKP